ncbi:hypothetical protein TELCIR_15535 [Teladorsagia circumcincta]|uniref:Uncharacterized protein n=1 Tax=Teladorsagia circumcincta TaxID=45464 RepID=A0A2G9TXW6_TELCI|nr:hypothetical protein TELCIR_15535 [Teladorsagia circumcincta]
MILRASLVLGCLALLLLIVDAEPTSCAFYCFVVPSRKEALDIASFRNLSCTHFVYGFSRIRSDMSLRSITSRDNLEINSPGNLRKFLGHFDGVFVRMEGPPLESTTAQHFISALSITPSAVSSLTTLSISPRWLWRVIHRIHEFADFVEHIYLDMEELPISEDAYAVSHLDPLMPSDSIPLEDTISGSVDK